MWAICEHRKATRQLSRLPQELLKRYENWKDIVKESGPDGLKAIKGFRDEPLKGKWAGCRSSRLNLHYRIIYQIESESVYILALQVTPHDYLRK